MEIQVYIHLWMDPHMSQECRNFQNCCMHCQECPCRQSHVDEHEGRDKDTALTLVFSNVRQMQCVLRPREPMALYVNPCCVVYSKNEVYLYDPVPVFFLNVKV